MVFCIILSISSLPLPPLSQAGRYYFFLPGLFYPQGQTCHLFRFFGMIDKVGKLVVKKIISQTK